MVRLFVTVLNMSVKASVCILAVMLIRLMIQRAPKIFSYLLWAVVLVRLICPVTFQVENFGVNLPALGVGQQQEESLEAEYQYVSGDLPEAEKDQAAAAANPGEGEAAGTDRMDEAMNADRNLKGPAGREWFYVAVPERVLQILSLIWAVTAVLLVMWSGLGYIRFMHSIDVRGVQTPFTAGILHPDIYLPEGLDERQRRLILEHERTHIKRLDYVVKPLAFLVCCIHWFNPLVWAAFLLMERDMEISCDEAVIRRLGYDIRKEYAEVLLCLAGAEGAGAGYPIGFGERNVKNRIRRVVKMKKTGLGIGVGAAAVVLLAAAVLLADRKKEDAGSGQTASVEVEEVQVVLPDQKVSQKEEAAPEEYVRGDGLVRDSVWVEGSDQDTANYLYDSESQMGSEVFRSSEEETIMNYDPGRERDQFEVLLLPETDSVKTDEEILFSCPVEYERISDTFGTRVHPATGDELFHSGIDFAAEKGTPVTAAADGIVAKTGTDTQCGNYVILLHGNGDATYYSCLDEILAEEGGRITRGDQIGTVGNSGTSTGPHLHFAVSREGKYIKPVFADEGMQP